MWINSPLQRNSKLINYKINYKIIKKEIRINSILFLYNRYKLMEELVWRKEGEERCQRSYKETPPINTNTNANNNNNINNSYPSLQNEGFRQVSNKREEANSKINERYLVGQPNQNPFMPSNNYINDIENQLNFLTPQKGC
jgi:hypothetical protein